MSQRLSFLTCLAACALFFAGVVQAEVHPGEDALVREVAKATGKNPRALTAILDKAKKQQSIIDAMNRPAEAKPWRDYRPIFMTDKRISEGVAFYRANRALVDDTARKYGVAPEIIVAIVGVETSYGKVLGKYKVIDALVTLAFYYPKRAAFFREQLKALLMLPENHLAGPVDTLVGSYAGAQGWGQFMPTSIRDWGVDADGNGHIDMRNSLPDIVASVANYFAKHGWEAGGPVALRAQPDKSPKLPDINDYVPRWSLEQFMAWGFAPLQHVDPGREATMVRLDGPSGDEYWFTFHNFLVITKYNRSPLYAMAVNQLAQAIAVQVRGSTVLQ